MPLIERTGYLPILVVAITLFSRIAGIQSPVFTWGLPALIIICILWYNRFYFHPLNRSDYRIVQLYFLWMLFSVIRGVFVAGNYWEWKQLIEASLCLSLPIFVYVFSIPGMMQKTLSLWIRIAIPAFVLYYLWALPLDSYHYYLGPVLLLACFLPMIPRKWQIIFLLLSLLMIFSDLGGRSQVIKAVMALLISMACLLSRFITPRILYAAHWLCYIAPIVLLILGITGTFNPFKALSDNAETYTTQSKTMDEEKSDEVSGDTRTFIYDEVIISAIKHQYIWQGRTPARGNDSWVFGAYNAEELKTGKYERHSNEVCHLNVFTWLGLIGLILYSLIYLKSSYLAVYKSNNIGIKLLGVYIAFRWAYGWVEDINEFDISNITLWMMIAMGFSERFRQMDDKRFQSWILTIFQK